MARPKFVQAKITTLKVGISATETSEIVLKKLVDIYDNEVAFSTFGTVLYLTFNPGGDNEEVISCTGFTRASDGSVTLSGITRGLAVTTPYASGGTASAHAAGTVVIVGSDTPHLLEQILLYMDEIAITGAPPASLTAAGYVEKATSSEIDADTEDGTAGPLSIGPDQLALSKYSLRLPSATQKTYLNAVTGMLVPYAGYTTPTGFLLCDATAYNNNDYPELAAALLGYFGLNAGTTFTADNATNVLTANSHGLSDGDIVFLTATTSLPAELSANTVYYVKDAGVNKFTLSTDVGGATINFTDNGTGTLRFHTQFKVPDLRGSVPIGTGQKVVTFDFLDAAVNTGTNVITVTSNDFLHTGQAVVLSNSGGALPTGLSATTYYVIRVTATTIKLATSVDNANAGTAVDITAAAGGGTHTLTLTMTSRTFAAAGGEETHALTDAEMPSHAHDVFDNDIGGSGSVRYASTTTAAGRQASHSLGLSLGSDTPHNNMSPYVVVKWLIKT